ncbi:hypothetical protein MKK58_12860 [Methylobacterium sp. J-078]|uniref:hypothetical protein n=1 Tax=Methylobacterium sp. J-078 TaxID=2836657 RepID=UPI001FB8E2A3|nr:hypothetical protein [Methylobacterium sp. J-078]MCJ2045411.1 hypothetical protein [Methylobacterium sp. J-078]
MLSIVLSIRNSGTHVETIKDLHKALAKIASSLGKESLYYRAIDLSGTWRSGEEEFNPWAPPNISAWADLARHPETLNDLRAWLEDVERLLLRHLAEEDTSILEAEEVLLGEVPLSILAVMHLDFVPLYTRFLDVWQDQNGPQQGSIVQEIVEAHGRSKEVEDLLFKLVVYMSGDGDLIEYNLRKNLEQLYGNFSQSELFRRMVEAMHARGSELQDSTGKRYIFSYLPGWPELTVAAETILAELDVAPREPY